MRDLSAFLSCEVVTITQCSSPWEGPSALGHGLLCSVLCRLLPQTVPNPLSVSICLTSLVVFCKGSKAIQGPLHLSLPPRTAFMKCTHGVTCISVSFLVTGVSHHTMHTQMLPFAHLFLYNAIYVQCPPSTCCVWLLISLRGE